MWGRRKSEEEVKAKAGLQPRPAALRGVESLLRPAEWERLDDAERTRLLAPFSAVDVSSAGDVAAQGGQATDATLQDWVAQLVSVCFQPQAAGVIRAWLDDGAPDAHLYIGGQQGLGRTSLAASLARRAMAQRPVPPEYCYVPDLAAIGTPRVLAVAKGTGAAFTGQLSGALRFLAGMWDAEDDDSDGGDSDGENSADDRASARATAPSTPRQRRLAAIAQVFAVVAKVTPASAQAYLDGLRRQLEEVATGDDGLPFDGDSIPVAHVTPVADDFTETPSIKAAGEGLGAPVVVATLASSDLTDALLRANGGALVLQAVELLDSSTWGALATALKSRTLPLKSGWPALPLDVRVLVVGSSGAYQALDNNTEDFRRIFRTEVWCNWDTAWTRDAEATYATLAGGVAQRHELPAFAPGGVSRLVEEAARRSEGLQRTRLTTSLLTVHDLALESARMARTAGAAQTTGEHVVAAISRRRVLQSSSAQRVREAVLSGQELTPTSGAAVGQINGLGIYEVHPSEGTFAVPMRISAIVSASEDARLLDIEREAEQADAEHVRGMMTMEGYLANRYGQTRPLSVAVRIRFEQQHGGTGGDSASAAELFAILSALSRVPVLRSLAVTGAVGQYGEIQPIGGVNTKIEGFWDLCRLRWAAGERPEGGYGVVIPAVNTRDLMLRPEVAQSIATEGWFLVYPISSVDEGIPLLLGVSAGVIHERVDQRLQHFYELALKGRTGRNS